MKPLDGSLAVLSVRKMIQAKIELHKDINYPEILESLLRQIDGKILVGKEELRLEIPKLEAETNSLLPFGEQYLKIGLTNNGKIQKIREILGESE